MTDLEDAIQLMRQTNALLEAGRTSDDDEPTRIDILTARQTAELPDPPLEDMLLGPLVVRRYRTIVAGGTGQGKTTLALNMVAAIVQGWPLLDWQGAGNCRALIVDLEQGLRTIKRRLREARLETSDHVDYARIPDGLALEDPTTGDAYALQQILENQYDLVVLDPHYKAHRGDSNEERGITDLMRLLDHWRNHYGFALILPAHNRKLLPGTKLTIDDVFGSSALVRGAEIVLGIQLITNGYSRLHFFKDRDGDLPVGGNPWGLIFNQDDGYRRDPKDTTPDRDLQTEITDYLTDHPGATTNEIVHALTARRETVSAILNAADSPYRYEPGKRNTKHWFPNTGTTREPLSFWPAEGPERPVPANNTPPLRGGLDGNQSEPSGSQPPEPLTGHALFRNRYAHLDQLVRDELWTHDDPATDLLQLEPDLPLDVLRHYTQLAAALAAAEGAAL